jgi:hypothetical protein
MPVQRYATQFASQTWQFREAHRHDFANPIEFDTALLRGQRAPVEDGDDGDVGTPTRSFDVEIARTFLG